MKYSIYGNCQSKGLANTLKKQNFFSELYEYQALGFVQNIQPDKVWEVEEAFKHSDLLIHQVIGDQFKIKALSTNNLMQYRKENSNTLTFPSLYFNGYFPHLDTFNGVMSILNLVHDYNIIYSYAIGLSETEIIELLLGEKFYSKSLSCELLDKSLQSLKEREKALDIKIADFIDNNYKNIKLFNQFNHPKGIVFDYIANQIFEILSMKKIKISVDSSAGLDGIMAPIYKSTYKNLGLLFKEDYTTYGTNKGLLQIDEVVAIFFNTYKSFSKDILLQAVNAKKSFIPRNFKELGI